MLIVTYNLKGSASSYTQFYEVLKNQGSSWWHYMPSTWLLDTIKTPEQVTEALRVHLQSSDYMFVGTLTNGYNGWLPKDAWEWMQKRGLNP